MGSILLSSQLTAGSKLVLIHGACTDLFEVERKGVDGGLYDSKWRRFCMKYFRPATPEEIKANKRLDIA